MKERTAGAVMILKEVAKAAGKKWTTRELSQQFGCDVKTINNHANRLFPGKIQAGKTTYFDEKEATVLLESIKKPISSGTKANLENEIRGLETELSLEMQIAIAERKAKELWKRKAEREEARAVKAEAQIVELTAENGRIQKDLQHANQKLEIAGLHLTDREDTLSLYRREKGKRV